jgi:hypothetical protein
MNNAQRKVLLTACFVFSPIFVFIGMVHESLLIGLVLPIALVFSALYVKHSQPKLNSAPHTSYEEYTDKLLPLIIENIAKGFDDAIQETIKDGDSELLSVAKNEVKEFVISNFNLSSFKKDYVKLLKRTYTQEELNFTYANISSDIGLSVLTKSMNIVGDVQGLMSPELSRVSELLAEKYDI